MTAPDSTPLGQLCTALQQQAAGLYYLSESEYPFEVISFLPPPGQTLTAADVLALAGQPAGTFMETVPLAAFFRNSMQVAANADAEMVRVATGLGQLQAFLNQQLPGIQVYRIGRRKITVIMLGQLPGQEGYAGLKTFAVET
jgi:hypothetical protein